MKFSALISRDREGGDGGLLVDVRRVSSQEDGRLSAPVKEGDVLAGKYRVERVVGSGGMGVVVAAWHLHLDERVALKFLLAEALKEPVTVARFQREGRAASKIRSEHVARVLDVGTLVTGAPYIVMEYLEGSDLAALVKARGPLDVPTAVEYTLQACEAIAEAHSVGIIHRDIKPSNLFVATRPDGSPVVKVIDFGISKMGTGVDAGMDITKTAEMRGSMLFISPEQMSSPRSVDPRSDIWSIGVSLYHLLTGSYPFRATSVPELCAMILQRAPAPLSASRPGVPPGLEACILRCLCKDPNERYANVAEFAEAVASFAPSSARLSVDRIRRLQRARATLRGSSPSIVPEEPRAPVAVAGADTATTVPILRGDMQAHVDAGEMSSTSTNRSLATTGSVSAASATARVRRGSVVLPAVGAAMLALMVTMGVAFVAMSYRKKEGAATESELAATGRTMTAPGVPAARESEASITALPVASSVGSASLPHPAPSSEASAPPTPKPLDPAASTKTSLKSKPPSTTQPVPPRAPSSGKKLPKALF